MKNILLTISAVATLGLLGSCTKEPLNNLTEDESRIYISNYDSTAQFSSYKTFSIVDSVAVISNNRLEGKAVSDFDVAVIAALKSRLQQQGYTLVGKDQDPDLGINVSRIYNTYTGIVSYPDYWGSYYGYYDPFYWGYPGYGYGFPSYYGTYSIKEGALSIDALDLKDAGADKKINGIWMGLVRGSGVFRTANVPTHISRLFDQSAYFKANQ
ncbi:DUF4136 domain-containing protein [Paraflavitalea sp. CAU 1676]|uniref:DUF4136 domain-containing protein n=1 Tax=Paraflavitalea sp. CAU 1676 TaxID=3032598 RepID=UPI0023DBA269|nr:DUF4136 domain-containing protein [Paraflavitalea sp. CAU 1676]MDF2187626.1 DUF4136 domain-containing protein [Paraflavitalea sp. CAU 1676]